MVGGNGLGVRVGGTGWRYGLEVRVGGTGWRYGLEVRAGRIDRAGVRSGMEKKRWEAERKVDMWAWIEERRSEE